MALSFVRWAAQALGGLRRGSALVAGWSEAEDLGPAFFALPHHRDNPRLGRHAERRAVHIGLCPDGTVDVGARSSETSWTNNVAWNVSERSLDAGAVHDVLRAKLVDQVGAQLLG